MGVQIRALGRKRYWIDACVAEDLLERRAELVVPIEEQITTSLTETMKILNVAPAPAAVNDDDDDDDEEENKGGFFSRFRRS